jgi:hypothetical protein
LNAGQPFTQDPSKAVHLRPRNRRNDFGFTFGGPVVLPKIYDGHDKLFFFFSFEQYRQATTTNSFVTVPTLAMRQGDFSAILGASPLKDSTGKEIKDVKGRSVYQNTIYDPKTEQVVNGVRVWDPFPGNKIPLDRMDPASLAVQSYMYAPGYGGATASGLIQNAMLTVPASVTTTIPSVKIDYSINPKAWAEPEAGKFGTSAAYYSDYRSMRHPSENVGLARNFRFGRDGRINLNLRAEFTNIFNRLYLPDPVATNYAAAQTKNPTTGLPSGGFGWINTLSTVTANNVRMGQIVGRLSF